MGFATDAIHVGQEPDPATGAIVAPIYQTSTYVQEELGKNKGYDYARTTHPNRRALERTVAKLEGGSAAYVFTSGMAAIDSRVPPAAPGRPRHHFGGGVRRRHPADDAVPGAMGTGVQLRGHVLARAGRARRSSRTPK